MTNRIYHPLFFFDFASEKDDQELRRLLREVPMPGAISVSMQREPNFFLAASIEGDTHDTVIARLADSGRLVAMGSRSVRDAYINGKVHRLGYLSQIRVLPEFRGKRSLLVGGFSKIKEKHQSGDCPITITTIIEDNQIARRTLGSGLRGFPVYREHETLSTLLIPLHHNRTVHPPASVSLQTASPGDLPGIATFLQKTYSAYQFAPVWTMSNLVDSIQTRGLKPEDFVLVLDRGKIKGCLAIWNQQQFKQTVVCGYQGALKHLRPLGNLLAPWLGYPRLPKPGNPFSFAFLSHLAMEEYDPKIFLSLIRYSCNLARLRGHANVSIGMSSRHPLLLVLRRNFKYVEYRSMLYTVFWPDGTEQVSALDDRIVHAEVATL